VDHPPHTHLPPTPTPTPSYDLPRLEARRRRYAEAGEAEADPAVRRLVGGSLGSGWEEVLASERLAAPPTVRP
jgi:hypothetical protein